jgi:putative transcriptional regulator
MPIIINLDIMLATRKWDLMNCGQMGITTANLSILKTGKAKAIRFSTLEAICEILECQPDFLQYVRKTNKEHIPYF